MPFRPGGRKVSSETDGYYGYFPKAPHYSHDVPYSQNRLIVRTNAAMRELLGGDPNLLESGSVFVPETLISELQDGFKEVDGCVVPCSFRSQRIWSVDRPRQDNADDETGLECLLSKTYLQDFLPQEVSVSELARVGLAHFFPLQKAIAKSHLSGDFRYIVDAQIPDTEEVSPMPACSVRFHKRRLHQHWLTEDLESYQRNALLVIDWHSPA